MSCVPQHDLCIHQGDDKTFEFRYSIDGSPVDLTGYDILLDCRDPTLDRAAVVLDQVTNTGEYTITYVPADTESSDSRKVFYEVAFYPTGVAGVKNTKYSGYLLISPEVL